MTITSKREVARILRSEAESIRKHGFTDFSGHNFNCLQAQALKADKCLGCKLREFVPSEYQDEAFPCQHIDPEGYERIFSQPELPGQIATRLLNLAEEIEAAARAEGA
jgi:hypothetical protein